MPLRATLAVTFIVHALVCAQPPQIDHAAVSKALKGRVESFEGGVLSLRYPFDDPSELEDFKASGFDPSSLRVEDGHLFMEVRDDADESAFLNLGPMHFEAPWSLRFKVTPKFKNSGLTIGLLDAKSRGGQTWVLLNAPLGNRKDEPIFAAFRARPGVGTIAVAGPRTREIEPDKAVAVEVIVKDDEMTVTFNGRRVLHDPFFGHKSFELAIGPAGPPVLLDDVRVWGKPVPASLRKLVVGEKAESSEEARRLEEGRTAGVAALLARIDEPISRDVRRAVRDLGDEAQALFVRARKAEGSRDFADAALLLQEASVIEADSAIVFWRAGWNLGLSGDHRLCEKALRKAVELDSELGCAWRDLGWILSLLERDDAALAAYDRALDLDPEDALAYGLKGMLLQGRGQLDEALELFEEARAMKPDVEAWNLLSQGVQRLKKPPDWKNAYHQETEHYAISTNVDEDFAKKVGSKLEVYRAFLEELMPLPETATQLRSKVWIFDARGEYNVFAGTLMSRTAEHTAGVYHPAIRTLLLFDDVDREATFDTLFHEAFHQYLDRVNRSAPIWFNEGMAELMGGLEVTESRVRALGIHHGRVRELRVALMEAPERIPDLDKLVTMPKVDFYDRDEASLHYAIAWSLCHFFMTGSNPEGRRLFREYARLILDGKRGEEAYAATFGFEGARKAESFRRAWLRHVRRL